ncbi:unnamed protein product [Merluccius merluccius]
MTTESPFNEKEPRCYRTARCRPAPQNDPVKVDVETSSELSRRTEDCDYTAVQMAAHEPHNFSWVDPGKLAALALPRMTSEYQYLLDHGVQHLVCLCERKPPNHDTCPGLQLHHIKVVDFTPPSQAQIDRFLSLVEEANSRGEGVAVHCMHGHGRTGTMLACYLVRTGGLSGPDAIREIRRLRRGSIETPEQEKAVVQFYQRTK